MGHAGPVKGRPILRFLTRLVAWLAGLLVLACVALTVVGWALFHTKWGERRLLGVLRPRLEAEFPGGARLDGIGGGLGWLELRGLVIDDATGRLAVSAEELRLRYRLLPLVHHRLDVEQAEARGVKVHLARLPGEAGGGWNLAALTRESNEPSRWSMTMRRATIDGEAVLDDVLPRETLRLQVHADGRLAYVKERFAATVSSVDAELLAPAVGGETTATVRGAVRLAPELRFDDARLTVRTSGAELARLFPSVTLRGPLVLSARLDGTARGLLVRGALRPAHGEVHLAGELRWVPRFSWSAVAEAQQLSPTLWESVSPAWSGALSATVRGAGQGSEVDLSATGLQGRVAGWALAGGGRFATQHGWATRLVVRPEAGAARQWLRQAQVKLSGQAGRFELRLIGEGPKLHAELVAHARQHAGENAGLVGAIDRLVVRLGAEPWNLPAPAPFRLSRARATLGRLRLVSGAQQLTLDGTVDLSGPGAVAAHLLLARLALDRVLAVFLPDLALPPLRLDATLAANGPLARPALDATLHALAGPAADDDLGRRAHFGSFRIDADLHYAKARLRGAGAAVELALANRSNKAATPSAAPGSLRFAVSSPIPFVTRAPLRATVHGDGLHLGRLVALGRNVRGGLEGGLSRGELEQRIGRGVGEALGAAPPAPGNTRTEPDTWAALGRELLRGRLAVALDLDGTWAAPRLEGQLHASWTNPTTSPDTPSPNNAQATKSAAQPQPSSGIERADLGLHGDAHHVTAQLSVGGAHGGHLVAQAESPTGLSALLASRSRLLARPIDASLRADLDLAGARLPPLGPGLLPSEGHLRLGATLDGTLASPRLRLHLDGQHLRIRRYRRVALLADARYDAGPAHAGAGQLQLDAHLGFRGGELVHLRGGTTLDLASVLTGRAPLDGPLTAEAQIPGYDLLRLRGWRGDYQQLAGLVYGTITVGGRLRDPTFTARLRVDALASGPLAFHPVTAAFDWDATGLRARLDAPEQGGGRLELALGWSRKDGALSSRLEARRFELPFLPTLAHALEATAGRLDASLAVGGELTQPVVRGVLNLSGGAFALREQAHRYRDIALAMRFRPGLVTLEHLAARSGDGTVTARGRATLAGLRPTRIDASATAKRFGLLLDGFAARLDGQASLHAAEEHGALVGKLSVSKGALRFPSLTSGKALQPLGPLEDVSYVGQQPRTPASTPMPVRVDVRVPGPFALRGKDVHADARGEVHVVAEGNEVRLTGDVDAESGWVDVLGRRFTVERARFLFGGESPVNPALDIRLARASGDVTLYVDVTGSAEKPAIALSSDPPKYSQSEVLGLLLSGQSQLTTVDQRTLQQKVVGALSGVIVSQLRDQLLPGLPVDVLKVELGTENPTGFATTRIEVGKYIAANIYVAYVHQFGSPQTLQRVNSNEATVEWRFARHFEIDSTYGDAGVGGVDFAFRVRF